MHKLGMCVVVLAALAVPSAQAKKNMQVVDCSRGASLAKAVMNADEDTTLNVSGTCSGAVSVTTNGITIDGNGSAVVTASNADVITVNGAQRITLHRITITGGLNGVVAENDASVSLQSTNVTANMVDGMLLEAGSTATLAGGVSVANNGVFGIDAESSSSLLTTGSNSVTGSGVFGIQVNNGASISLTNSTLTLQNNTLGIQLGTNGSGFIDNTSSLNASGNFADGVTIVSGAHVVLFGGQITSSNNGIHGVSINSKAGLDMDAGSQLTVMSNGQDGVHMERASSMTVFNNPAFSGFNGTSTIHASGNQGIGVNLQTNSGILVSNYAAIQSTGNAQAGVSADDGSSVSFTQTTNVQGVQTNITGNNPDLLLTFGSRLTLLSNDTYGTAHCDATVLTRGPNAPICPQ
jgi:hypothetical protein